MHALSSYLLLKFNKNYKLQLPHFLSDVARNGFLLMLIVIMAVKLPTQVKEKNGQIIYEKAPLNTSYTDQTWIFLIYLENMY